MIYSSCELVAQLQADNEHLRQERVTSYTSGQVTTGSSLSSDPAWASRPTTEQLVFLLREKKCPIFQGNTGIGIDDWINEARACMRVHHLSLVDQAYFLFDHLEGQPREEIRHRSQEEKEDPEAIIEILQKLYGCLIWHCRRLSFQGNSKGVSPSLSFPLPL